MRRQKLLRSINESQPFLIVLFNSPVYPSCSDAHYRHRTDSSFFYITGLTEEESAALLWQDGKRLRYQLFVRARDPLMEQWNGSRLGPEGAQKKLSPDETFTRDQLPEKIEEWFKSVPKGSLPRIYSNFSTHDKIFEELRHISKKIVGHIRMGKAEVSGYLEILPYIRSLRLIKDDGELAQLKEASRINVRAHRELMERLKPGMYEHHAQAILEKIYLEEGARGPGYDPILGSGPNATILHYHENGRLMKENDLLLADAGCEFRMYQSDITRTLPVGQVFSSPQRKIVELVEEAQKAAIACCVEGKTIEDFHKAASTSLIEGLKSLKLLKGETNKILEKGDHKRYYPHGTGHWLGLDVHDPCPSWNNGSSIKFQAGMVITVEPGLYFLESDTTVPEEYRGIGVRIEDNIVIRPKGQSPLNLTADLPRSWKDIESVRKSARRRAE